MDRLMDIPSSAELKRVVVVGGGFAGLVSAGTGEGIYKKHCTFKIHIGVMR